MKFNKRSLRGVLVIIALLCVTTYAAVACNYSDTLDAFIACLPVFIVTLIAWRVFLFGRTNSLGSVAVIGALSGVCGTLIWPTGYHLWGPSASEGAYLLVPLAKVLLIVASFLGAAIAVCLTVSFPDKKAEELAASTEKNLENSPWPTFFTSCIIAVISISFVLVATWYEFSPEVSLAGLVMILIRYPQIFYTRRLEFSIPLFVVFLLLPIVVQWGPISKEWTNTYRPLPASFWITWGIVYFALPTVLFLFDYAQTYGTKVRQLGRIIVDLVMASIWMYVLVELVQSFGHKN